MTSREINIIIKQLEKLRDSDVSEIEKLKADRVELKQLQKELKVYHTKKFFKFLRSPSTFYDEKILSLLKIQGPQGQSVFPVEIIKALKSLVSYYGNEACGLTLREVIKNSPFEFQNKSKCTDLECEEFCRFKSNV